MYIALIFVAVLWLYKMQKNTAIPHNYWVCSLRNGSLCDCLRVFLADFQTILFYLDTVLRAGQTGKWGGWTYGKPPHFHGSLPSVAPSKS